MTVFQAKAGDDWKYFLKAHPTILDSAKDEASAADVVLKFLDSYEIQFYYDPDKTEMQSKYDDLKNYDREGIACWVLSAALDDAESEEDSELLEALRLTIVLEFLNKNSSGAQTAAYCCRTV